MLSALMILEFENAESENYVPGSPKRWDSELSSKIDFSKYDAYHICSEMVPAINVNRITDYKKIWGLRKIPKGLFDGCYDFEKGRIYFGIIKGDANNAFNNNVSSIIALMPKSEVFLLSEVFNSFAMERYDFYSHTHNKMFLELMNRFPGSIWLRYSRDISEHLDIWMKGAEILFSPDTVKSWDNQNYEPVFHHR